MTLRRRLGLLAGTYIGIIVLGGAAVLVTETLRQNALVRQRSVAVANAEVVGLRAAFLRQETGQHGYLLTGDDTFLESFESGIRDAEALLSNPELVEVDPLRAQLAAAEEAWRRWLSEAARPQIAARRSPDASDDAVLDQERGGVLFEALRVQVERIATEVEIVRADVDDRLSDLRLALRIEIAVVLLATLATTAAAVAMFQRRILSPVDAIGGAAREVADGARETPVPVSGPLELARLGRDVERMRMRLNANILAAESAREAVERNAALLFTLRTELEPIVHELPGEWTAAARVQAAEGIVAGDCYDFVALGGSGLGLTLVDVAGHGAVPGILALRYRDLLRAGLRNGLDPAEATAWASEQLDDLDDERFLTSFCLTVDLDSGVLRYANAGHPPGILCGASAATELERTGPLVGGIGTEWETRRVVMAPGDTLAIYTDGIIEARDDARDPFGLERLADLVCAASCDQAEAIVKGCLDAVTVYSAGRTSDDATMVLLCRGPREDRPTVRLAPKPATQG